LGAPNALAGPLQQSGAPSLVSYQGYLTDADQQPISGTVTLRFGLYASAEGGTPLWEETQSGVAVQEGLFAVLLGSSTPLNAADFDDTSRYLQVSVDTGGGFEDLPRQQLAAVPYALQAEEAKNAAAAPWSGLTGIPAGFADNVDDAGANYENVIIVAKGGGDYTSVAEALNSITDPGPDDRYLVWVAPGVYTETQLSLVQSYVHLQGSGPNATIVKSGRTNSTQTPDAATAQLDDNGRISDLGILNEGTGTYGIGLHSTSATRAATLHNVHLEANGGGGTAHYAIYLNDSEPTIQHSTIKASGASLVNAALGSINASGGFPQPLIIDSTLIGGSGDGKTCADATGTGFGLQMTNSAPDVRNSYICGGHRGIFSGLAGIPRIRHSHVEVSSTSGAFLFETTGASTITVANSGVFYVGNKHTGAGGLTCVNSYKANYTAATDSTTAATACN
jgi:hypothetical protein